MCRTQGYVLAAPLLLLIPVLASAEGRIAHDYPSVQLDSRLALYQNRLLAWDQDGSECMITCLRPDSGKVTWHVSWPGSRRPRLTAGLVFFLERGIVVAVDPVKGERVATLRLGSSEVPAEVAYLPGKLVLTSAVGGGDARLSVFDFSQRKRLWTVSLGSGSLYLVQVNPTIITCIRGRPGTHVSIFTFETASGQRLSRTTTSPVVGPAPPPDPWNHEPYDEYLWKWFGIEVRDPRSPSPAAKLTKYLLVAPTWKREIPQPLDGLGAGDRLFLLAPGPKPRFKDFTVMDLDLRNGKLLWNTNFSWKPQPSLEAATRALPSRPASAGAWIAPPTPPPAAPPPSVTQTPPPLRLPLIVMVGIVLAGLLLLWSLVWIFRRRYE